MILILCFGLMASGVTAGPTTFEGGSIRKFNNVGHGECGHLMDPNNGLLASVGEGLWTDSICRQCIEVSYNGQTLTLPVVDKCHDCANHDILVSAAAYERLAQTYPGPYELEGGSFKFAPCAPTSPPPSGEIHFEADGAMAYFASAGNAACGGRVNGSSDWDWNVAVSSVYFAEVPTNADPICQKCVLVNYNGIYEKLPIRDKCVGCPANEIMVSKQVMRKFTGNLFQGVHGGASDYLPTAYIFSRDNGNWRIVSC